MASTDDSVAAATATRPAVTGHRGSPSRSMTSMTLTAVCWQCFKPEATQPAVQDNPDGSDT